MSVPGVRLVITQALRDELMRHLFPGDGDEHGAVLLAGVTQDRSGLRLFGRELLPATDGVDYVPGQRGYRMLTPDFVGRQIRRARNERLAYLAIHNHSSGDQAVFSGDDMRSHERGYPALLAIAKGLPVGALVVAERALAGDIWLPDGGRAELAVTVIVGSRRRELRAGPTTRTDTRAEAIFHRQSLMLGAAGQQRLRQSTVGVIGAGGAGMLLVEWLARLGVGRLIVADPDRVHPTNLPRLPGATRRDALNPFRDERWPRWLRQVAARLDRRKVDIARRLVRAAPGPTEIEAIFGDFRDAAVARRFTDCDFLLLAADTDQCRLLANAISQRYLIPGAQVGSKVSVDRATGRVTDIHAVMRPLQPGPACLWCNGIVSPARLAAESATAEEERAQRYVDDAQVTAPSVITLNATACALAANRLLFYLTGLNSDKLGGEHIRIHPLDGRVRMDEPQADPACPECGLTSASGFARGDGAPLPTRVQVRPV